MSVIISNQVRCKRCKDTPYSRSRHDFRSCKCGAVAVDGGMDYLRRVATDLHLIEDMSIELPEKAVKAARENIRIAQESGRNSLGILCAVMRALRDEGVTFNANS